MKNKLLKYKLNIDEYKKLYGFYIQYINYYIANKKLKYKNSGKIYGIGYTFEDLINGYINHTEKDHLFELYTSEDNYFYTCVGNLPMYDRNDKKYGDYFLIIKLKSNINRSLFKIEKINEYLKIEDFVNRYKKVEDKIILDNFNKIKEYNEFE